MSPDRIDKMKLADLIRRETEAWAEVYAKEREGPELVRALLRGAEAVVREHLGWMPPEERADFGWGYNSRGYCQGRMCMYEVDLYRADIFKAKRVKSRA